MSRGLKKKSNTLCVTKKTSQENKNISYPLLPSSSSSSSSSWNHNVSRCQRANSRLVGRQPRGRHGHHGGRRRRRRRHGLRRGRRRRHGRGRGRPGVRLGVPLPDRLQVELVPDAGSLRGGRERGGELGEQHNGLPGKKKTCCGCCLKRQGCHCRALEKNIHGVYAGPTPYQVLGAPRHDGDIEHRVVGVGLQAAQDEDVVVLEDQVVAGAAALERASLALVHALVPVCRRRKLAR